MPSIDDENPDDRAARERREQAQDQKIAELGYELDRMLSGEELAVKYGLASAPSRDYEGDFLRKMQEEILTGKAAHALEMIDFDMRSCYRVPAINWAMRGLANLVLGNWRACIADAAKALAEQPGLAAAHALQAEAHLRLGEIADARAAADLALVFDPGEPRAKAVLARCQRQPWGWPPGSFKAE